MVPILFEVSRISALVSTNIDIKTKPDEDMIKTKKIKRRNQYLDEAKSKES